MDVTEQINKNECGICVINSFFNFFYKKDIKQELLNDSKIIKFGLSIYDFEVLCDKYGMKCECFSLTNEEFIELSEKK
jgi:ABC-type bacteriocin/lantibiotic exporter with double-glycine peptidase domain